MSGGIFVAAGFLSLIVIREPQRQKFTFYQRDAVRAVDDES